MLSFVSCCQFSGVADNEGDISRTHAGRNELVRVYAIDAGVAVGHGSAAVAEVQHEGVECLRVAAHKAFAHGMLAHEEGTLESQSYSQN